MLWSITYLSIYFLLVNGMLCVFQVRKHQLISALVADPWLLTHTEVTPYDDSQRTAASVFLLMKLNHAFNFAIASAIASIDTMRSKLLANYCNKMLGVS